MTWGSAALRISGETVQAANDSRPDEMHQWRQRRHAANRVGERYGVVVDTMHLLRISDRIATGLRVQPGLILIGHAARDDHGRRTSIWLAEIEGREVPLVYDHVTQSVVTVLPRDAIQLRFNPARKGYFPALANGGAKAARRLWLELWLERGQ